MLTENFVNPIHVKIKALLSFSFPRTFLKELEKCTENPELLARCFLKRVCQRQLGHSLPLFKYLRGPSQRLMKYQMLLKFSPCKDPKKKMYRQIYIHPHFSIGWRLFAQQIKLAFYFLIFNKAFGLMQGLLDFESPEDLEMDPGDLEGGLAKDDIRKLGKLLMHGSFNVWTVHKDRYKMKDLIRFKPSQRQIYLFEQGIVFCKIRMEPSDQGLSPHYSFKKSMKLMTLSIRQLGRGSNRKFEIANQNGLEKYILQVKFMPSP
ncbi:hypothetical protein EI555_003435 [Monodon monoceros]|uniref:SOS1/NGEF-like PH domain-containing protein n=1 Tax=Monodon monoceros TaxID=40151 RepID=A0A4U1FRN4_MONMO|nr:hypothetical protein EI555_003435 [Monodon monoceros]